MVLNDQFHAPTALHPVKSPQSVPTKQDACYVLERVYTISEREFSFILVETEVSLLLPLGQQVGLSTALLAVFVPGQTMGLCNSDECNANYKRNIICSFQQSGFLRL
jgi:hypothetical protein